MGILHAILLGIIQGLTEFLPISSSGHLALAEKIFGLDSGGFLLVSVLHLGTLIAVFIAFRKTIWELIRALCSLVRDIFTGKFSWKRAKSAQKMIIFLIVSLIPLFFILPIKDYIEQLTSITWAVGIALIITGIVLFISDRLPAGGKKTKELRFRDAAVVGIAQAIAVVPGISRSGSTITAGLACGMDRSYAAKYSFILSIPTILAGAAISLKDGIEEGIDTSMIPTYIIGLTVSAIVGFFAIKLLQYLLKSKKFFIFALYCVVVGVIAVIAGLVL